MLQHAPVLHQPCLGVSPLRLARLLPYYQDLLLVPPDPSTRLPAASALYPPPTHIATQVVAVNTDNKLQRATRPVVFMRDAQAQAAGGEGGAAASVTSVPVHQLLRLNVGHKDGIFKLTVRWGPVRGAVCLLLQAGDVPLVGQGHNHDLCGVSS